MHLRAPIHLPLALLLPAAILGSASLYAQEVVGLPQRPPHTVSTAPPASAAPATLSPNQAFDRRPAGEAPRVSAAALSPSQIRITWNAVPGAVGYLVRRNPETAPVMLTPTAISGTELVDQGLLPNTAAGYDVWADFGPQSPNSPGRSKVVPAATPPPVNPSGFTAKTAGSGSFYEVATPPYHTYLQWNPAPGAAYYSVKSNGQLVYEGAASTAGVSGVPQGEHSYDLLAYYGPTGAAIADTSRPARASGNAYPVPNFVATITGPNEVTLSWDSVPDATGYIVIWQTVDPQTGMLGPEKVAGLYGLGLPRAVAHRGASSGTTYRYSVFAKFDRKGPSALAHATVRMPS
jgi:hypothetical protein